MRRPPDDGGPGDVDVEEVLAWLARSDVRYLRLRSGGTEVVYSRLGGADGEDGPTPARGPAPADGGAPASAPTPVPAAADDAHRVRAEPTVDVTAPMAGIFHHAPAPGAPPYVEEGARVGATSAVGLLESMKVFTAVPAGTAGVVAAVVAPNGQPVEKGDPLVRVHPDAPG